VERLPSAEFPCAKCHLATRAARSVNLPPAKLIIKPVFSLSAGGQNVPVKGR
jgi:hypothetical protein